MGPTKTNERTNLEHVELLRRVVVQSPLGLLHPVRGTLHVLDEESQAAQLLFGAGLADGPPNAAAVGCGLRSRCHIFQIIIKRQSKKERKEQMRQVIL